MALHGLKLALAPPAWWLLTRAWSCNTTSLAPQPATGPVIFACLHRDIMPAIWYCHPARPTLLVSKSPDGVILINTLTRDGYRFARGSTGHDGHEGFVGLLRTLREGRHVGLAVDGPRGPFGHVHDGVLQLARRSGASIVPLTVHGRGCLHLDTWDRTRVPLPWARLVVTAATPLIIPAGADDAELADLRVELARLLGLQDEDCDGDH